MAHFLSTDDRHPTKVAHKSIADSVLDVLESVFGNSQSYQLSSLSSQLSATSAVIKPSRSVSVPEPSLVSVLGAAGLWFLGQKFQKRLVS
ncbi:MAG: hypothetical protein HC847_05525 [Hydrococcus sp. RU_2_2]|nr:hypothetical protein [Hydrococcus sp. RU_2_2]